MSAAPLPHDEFQRLMALARYEVLDTLPEDRFDRLTALTAEVLDVPVAVVNFVDQFRQWGKSCVGLQSSEAPREDSFCAWTILSDDLLVIPDAHQDPRFQRNPMVTGAPHIHLYAGAPLITTSGHAIGTLCVTDTKAHPFGDRERRLLRRLADLVVEALEDRLRERHLTSEVRAAAAQVTDLQRAAEYALTLADVTACLNRAASADDLTMCSAALLHAATGADWTGVLSGPEDAQACGLHVLGGWPGVTPPAELEQKLRDRLAAFLRWREYSLFTDTGEAPAVAVVDLGRAEGTRYLLAQLGAAWTPEDRALLDAAARTVRGGLDRQGQLQRAQADARTDRLTGLGNRRAFDEHLLRTHAQAQEYRCLAIDLDGLKSVNDTEGHGRGDTLLRLFGQTLDEQFRAVGSVYRLGGDEFAVLSTEPSHTWTDDELLELVDLAVAAVRALSFRHIGASAGLATGPAEHGGPEAVVGQADQRMYEQKNRKRQLRPPVRH